MDKIDEIELKSLRPGRDQYSPLTLPELTALRPEEAKVIAEQLPDLADQRSALRLVLRGLSVEKAVVKINLDREMVVQLRNDRRSEKEIRESLGMTDDEFEKLKTYKKGN